MKFKIIQIVDEEKDRVEVSHEVLRYFEKFITNEILIPYNIIINSNWDIVFAISLVYETSNNKPIVLPPNSFTKDKIKSYTIITPVKEILNSKRVIINYINMVYEAIIVFFTTNYRKIKREDLVVLKNKIDLEKLLSLEYPATYSNQKYEED